MIPPQRYFPWRIAREVFFANVAIIAFLLIVTGVALHIFILEELGATAPAFLPHFDQYLISLLGTIFLVAIGIHVFSSNRFVTPLSRLIQRARELRRLDAPPEEAEDGDEGSDDPGEWSDLERVLNRIHRDLRAKTDALSREREELSALIGAVSDAILAVDRTEKPLFFNSQFATLFRTAPAGNKALTLGEMFRTPEVLDGYRQVLRTGEMRVVAASLHTTPFALARHFSISIAPLKTRNGENADGAIGIFHDVTELKQSEQIRIEFVGNASHELRTPLTSIKGYVDTLRIDINENRFDGATQFINIISRNVDRLIFLVNDLLDLSALESGAELAKIPVSTAEVTESALRQIENKRVLKRQEIHVQLGVPRVSAEPQRLEQILVNLVHNAIKYIPEGSRIDVIWEVSSGGGTLLRVRDNGPGIPFEHQPRIFERFYRIDAGRSRDQGGTGLGLAIVKHIMLKHGGTVKLVSRPGIGCEFICYFP